MIPVPPRIVHQPRFLILQLQRGVDQPELLHLPKRLWVGVAGGADQSLLAVVVLEGHQLEPLGILVTYGAPLPVALLHCHWLKYWYWN